MSKTKTRDVRDLIVEAFKKDDRNLSWLSRKTNIGYTRLYNVLMYKIFMPSPDELKKINEALGTNFSIPE